MKISEGSTSILEKQKPYLAVLFVQFVYAGLALVSKAAINRGMNPYIFVAYRQAIATIILAPFSIFLERNMAAPLSYSILFKIFFISLFGITLSLNLYAYSLNYTSATFAAASTNTIPAITFVMAVLLRLERLSLTKRHGIAKVLGSIIGLSGAMVFAFVRGPDINFLHLSKGHRNEISSSSMKSSSHGQWVKGSLILLLSNITWSSWLIMLGRIVKEYPAKMRLTTMQCMFSSIQSALFSVAMERDGSAWKLGWDINLFSVAYCGIIVTGITYWLQLWAVEKKGPVFTAMFTPLALIVTAIISSLVWKEILHLGSVCGAIFLVVGLYCVLWGKIKEAEAEVEAEPEAEGKLQEEQKSDSKGETEV